jgi:uncharacterized membrane protein YraQ (UPF0718 family)
MSTSDAEFSSWLWAAAGTFTTTIAGLAFETIPFLLMGTLLSAFIQVFVPDRALRKIFPRNHLASIGVALVIGAIVPICECGTVPLARRLRRKGLPLSTATAFLLAAPLVNPMTIASTYVAFQGTGYRLYAYRLVVGLVCAFALALLVEWASRLNPSIDLAEDPGLIRFSPAAMPRPPRLIRRHPPRRGLGARFAEALDHATFDFFDSCRFLVLGISVAALARACVPLGALVKSLGSPVPAASTGAAAAYVLSLCSSADAFVARSLFAPASYEAALSFLILGPMIDIKNTILLSRFVRPKHLAPFLAAIFAVVVATALASAPIMEALR